VIGSQQSIIKTKDRPNPPVDLSPLAEVRLLHTGTLGSIYHKNPETFIRNATGKALVDSPALNAHSRAVLIPLARNAPPSASVNVPGPGPPETHTHKESSPAPGHTGMNTSKPPPPIPRDTNPDDLLDMSDSSAADVYDDDNAVTPDANDPYSNMDGAFGNYLADEPQPMGKGQRGDLDDLLF